MYNLRVYIPYFEHGVKKSFLHRASSLTYKSYHSLLGRMPVAFAIIIWSTATIPQAQFTQFLQTATTAGFSL